MSKHLTFANAISCVALFVALSGAAYAATTTLGKKSVKTQNLANGSVTTLKLRGGSVTSLKLRNGAVTGSKIGPGAVGSTQIANGAVRSAALGGGVVTEGKLKNGAVTESKLFNSAVTNSKIGPNAVATGKIQDGAITSPKLAASLLAQLIKNVSYVTKTTEPSVLEKSESVQCPAGKQVIGGGARIVGVTTKVAVSESAPTPESAGKRTGWAASAVIIEGGPGAGWSLEVSAICAEF
jgi:hypothetical protein